MNKSKRLKLWITSEIQEDYKPRENEPEDRYAEFVRGYTLKYFEMALRREYDVTSIGDKFALLDCLHTEKQRCDLVFNVAEGLNGRNREGEIPAILEIFGVPYVGSDPLTLGLALDKRLAKQMLKYHNIPTPEYFGYAMENGQVQLEGHKGEKVIIKCTHEGSSMGIKPDSISADSSEIEDLIRRIETNYHQKAFIEEYIEGREFTVMIMGNDDDLTVYPPIEVCFKTSIPFICSGAQGDLEIRISDARELNQVLSETARRAHTAFNIRDICRIDFRVDSRGNAYVIDLNPIPSYDPGTHFTLLGEHLKIGHRGMLKRLIDIALKRIYGEV